MKEWWNGLSQPVKTKILVWSPVVIVVLIYASAYIVMYTKAKGVENKYDAYASACLTGSQSGSPWSLNSPGINHGTLGLPVFGDSAGSVSASEIPKPGSC